MDQNNILSIVALVIAVGGTVVGIFNHKRVVSTCCGRKLEASIDINQTTPPPISAPKT
jgi:hypothetical protein